MPYHYLDGLTLADYAFQASGNSPEKMFEAAAQALMALMISNPAVIASKNTRYFEIHSNAAQQILALEDLLHLFLERLIHLKDAENSVVRVKSIEVDTRKSSSTLKCEFYGEPIDPKKHRLGIDVKAITQHGFKIERSGDLWIATVVVDV